MLVVVGDDADDADEAMACLMKLASISINHVCIMGLFSIPIKRNLIIAIKQALCEYTNCFMN